MSSCCSLSEIEKAVNEIEQEIFEQTGGVEYFNVVVMSNGFCTKVKFLDIDIWCSEDDMREEDEETQEYEPILTYLCRTINKELAKLTKVSL